MSLKIANNALSRLASPVSAAQTTLTLVSGGGSSFPVLADDDAIIVTLIDDLGNMEIVRCIGRSGDVLTIVRAQENTTAKAFGSGSLVHHRLTAGVLNEYLPPYAIAKKLLSEATLRLNYADNRYRVYEGLAGMADKTFAEAQTFTRVGDATGITATGRLATVGSNLPRLVGNRGGFLDEGAATNLLLWSEDFSNANWIKGNSNITANNHTSPDGSLTADKLVPDTSLGFHRLTQNATSAAGLHTAFVFAKRAGYNKVVMYMDNHSGESFAYSFDLVTGAFAPTRTPASIWTNCSAQAFPLADDYFLIVITGTTTSGNVGVRICPDPGTTYSSYGLPSDYSGDGTSGIYVWGADLKAGPLSSYIKTEGAQATRAADVCSRTLGAEYRADEGTLYWELFKGPFGEGQNFGFFGPDGMSNRIVIMADVSGSADNRTGIVITKDGVMAAIAYGPPMVVGSINKVCISWGGGVARVCTNGVYSEAPITGDLPTSITRLSGSISASVVGFLRETHRDIAYFPRALSEAELIALTTL